MEDVQSHAPQVALNIDRVGVRELKLPLLVRDRCQGTQQTVATVDLGVDLPSSFKGTHMVCPACAVRLVLADLSILASPCAISRGSFTSAPNSAAWASGEYAPLPLPSLRDTSRAEA